MLTKLLLIQLLFYIVGAWSPTNSYIPGYVQCPSDKTSYVREANDLSTAEKNWLSKRHAVTQENLAKFLKYTAKLNESDYSNLLSNNTINVGLAFSGGGYRAMLVGAGQIAALDNRTTGAFEHGLGGLLESTTYLSGLSGGNWLVGTLAMNNWTSVQDIIKSNEIWDLKNPLFALGGIDVIKNTEFWQTWISETKKKNKAGFDISFIDIWAQALSSVFFSEKDNYGAGATWSSIKDTDVFSSGQMPFPISVSQGKFGGKNILLEDSTLFETNPFELGTWDPTGDSFTDLQYIGTNYTDGKPYDTGNCVEGYDNAGFVMASSSDVFNIPFDDFKNDLAENLKLLYKLTEKLLNEIDENPVDEAVYPNPFYDSKYGTLEEYSSLDTLSLVDGSEDKQNIPLVPLVLSKRNSDIVFAFDSSADTNNWPNGASMVATYERQFADVGSVYSFPYVPPTSTFLDKNFTHRPVFFGCDAKNLTDLSSIPPIVVYIANSEYSYSSNTVTLDLIYDEKKKLNVIQNGFETTSRNNLTDDSQWATCVGCAVIRRSQERADIEQSEVCKKCFQDYCWDGTV